MSMIHGSVGEKVSNSMCGVIPIFEKEVIDINIYLGESGRRKIKML